MTIAGRLPLIMAITDPPRRMAFHRHGDRLSRGWEYWAAPGGLSDSKEAPPFFSDEDPSPLDAAAGVSNASPLMVGEVSGPSAGCARAGWASMGSLGSPPMMIRNNLMTDRVFPGGRERV